MSDMKRRDFITLIGGTAVTWPLAARAQQAAIPVIGYIGTGSRESDAFRLPSFHQGLSETGYVEGQNVVIEYRWAEGKNDRFPALLDDLVRRHVTVIAVPASTPGALAAKAATTTIPIVFYIGLDPVELGLVASLAHPGGNITGVTGWNVQVGPKRLELLHEMVPTATIMALLVNPTSPNLAEADWREQQAALTIRHGVPTIHQYREFAVAGGLMAYGSPTADLSRQVGVYTGRILKGEKPADLPVQQATKVELFINLKTAKTLGLTVPPALLIRANEVIE
jgi:putative ABC transport system substrate-binding protein